MRLAEARGLKLRQSDRRVSQKILSRIGRYAHARQMKRVARETRKLKTILGRVVRDAMHKIGENRTLEACFHEPLMQTVRLLH